MITVTVKYLGGLSSLTKKQDEKIRLKESSTVGGLVDTLCKKYGSAFAGRVKTYEADAARKGRDSVIIVCNGAQAGPDMPARHGDVFVISFPVGGG